MGKRYQLPGGGHADRKAFHRKAEKLEKKIQDVV